MYQFFGSGDSRDTDVVFFVPALPGSIRERSQLCAEMISRHFSAKKSDKVINGNLAQVNQGILTGVYKGTADELNNALYCTYALHRQDHLNQVTSLLPRDVDLKIIRCTRMILSALTRTRYRTLVKPALQGNMAMRLLALKQVDITTVDEAGKGYDLIDIRKLFAFQLGQTLALSGGEELYTKNSIIAYYPVLEPYLKRSPSADLHTLQLFLETFTTVLENRIPLMDNIEEYSYKHPDSG